MTEKKGGRAGDDLAHLRAQLGRRTPVSQPVEPELVGPEEESLETKVETKVEPELEVEPGTERAEDTATRARMSGRKGKAKSSTKEKPRRITVDLDADRYMVLRQFAFEERTKGTEVLRGLLDLLQDDPRVADELRERLAVREE